MIYIRNPHLNFRDENYSVRDEKYTSWNNSRLKTAVRKNKEVQEISIESIDDLPVNINFVS